jgi:hypothetical protein
MVEGSNAVHPKSNPGDVTRNEYRKECRYVGTLVLQPARALCISGRALWESGLIHPAVCIRETKGQVELIGQV